MSKANRRSQRGQALIMTTFAAILLFGMLGLTVDLGWSYFTRKSAQAAADAAAMAAVRLARTGAPSDYLQCGVGGVTCAPSPVSCSSISGTNLQAACDYAARAGFPANSVMDVVTVQASDKFTAPTVIDSCGQGGTTVHHAPTAGCVESYYWVTARVSRRIPQLFSAIMGNWEATAGARATAAFSDQVAGANLWALNRQFETPVVGRGDQGNDIYVWGNSEIHASGIVLASTAAGLDSKQDTTAAAGGAGRVYGETSIRGSGAASDPTKFVPPPTNGYGDLPLFDDPMRGKLQPPAPTGLPDVPLLGGVLNGGDCLNPPTYGPGSYYAVRSDRPSVATGAPITINGCVKFSASSGFGNYVFFGGLDIGSGNTVTFSPGSYFLAGTTTTVPSAKGPTILAIRNNAVLQDNTPLVGGEATRNTDAGEIFVFTDANYPGLQVPSAVQPIRDTLTFGQMYFQDGNSYVMNLHGLNADSLTLPAEYSTYAPTVFWQDRRNSPVLYDSDGFVDTTSCGSGHTLDLPCPNTDPTIEPAMVLQASPQLHLYGVVYQPRGAGIEFQGNNHIRTPVQLITGTVSMQGGSTLELQDLENPLRRRIVALIE